MVSTENDIIDQKIMHGLNTSTVPAPPNLAVTTQNIKKSKFAETPNKGSFNELSSIGRSLMEKNTAIGDTTNQSLITAEQMLDSPIRFGGKKILRNDLNMHSIDRSDQIQEENH